ncbi:MAG: Ldh family oxidoreductase [Peptococcaceae bacterium]|nr:Ldh family oxidoreductase [Peptococcaceae bacterium]
MPLFSQQKIFQFCQDLLQGAGVPPEDATIVADVLLDASLEGIDTHGISRLPVYLTRIQSGRINPRPDIKVNRASPSLAGVDGDNGLGQLVAVRSMQVAIKMARETGVGAVAARRSNHYGASSYYCKMASSCGMAGMAFTNTPPGIPPWGGKKAYFGTNPVAFAFPGKNRPVVIDMSSSTVARGNIILAAKEGKPIPEGWAIDGQGRPTTDPRAALEGAVLPMAGPKGYAMALAVEILSGVLSGSAYGPRVGWIYDDSTEPVDIGHFFLAVDIDKLMPLDRFLDRMNHMVREIKSSPRAEGIEEIFIPGERRFNTAERRSREGIPVSGQLLEELNRLARDLGVGPLE